MPFILQVSLFDISDSLSSFRQRGANQCVRARSKGNAGGTGARRPALDPTTAPGSTTSAGHTCARTTLPPSTMLQRLATLGPLHESAGSQVCDWKHLIPNYAITIQIEGCNAMQVFPPPHRPGLGWLRMHKSLPFSTILLSLLAASSSPTQPWQSARRTWELCPSNDTKTERSHPHQCSQPEQQWVQVGLRVNAGMRDKIYGPWATFWCKILNAHLKASFKTSLLKYSNEL